ncbi:MAG: tetratricopeptide repeat protein, partial [Planctomycetes bacterium]|nr:tetratricopeptide repeat protein [Planctomycetota bacterium]
DDALANTREAVELDPEHVHAHFNMGTILYMKGELEEAMKEYKATILLSRPYADAYYNVAKIYEEWGMRPESESYMAQYNKAKATEGDATGVARKVVEEQNILPDPRDYVR